MTAILLGGDTVLQLPSARIARDDVAAVRDALALLEEAKARRDAADAETSDAVRQGYEEGRQEALAEMRDALGAALGELHDGLRRENERRERAAAAAAMQAVERLIGAREDADVTLGLVREALRQSGAAHATVIVSPDLVDAVRRSLSGEGDTAVEADASLGPFACRVIANDGRIIADLDTQLAALRARWGLDGEGANG